MTSWLAEAGLSNIGGEAPYRFAIHTFGCKVNTYDTGLLQKRLLHAGHEQAADANVHILNTCAVTAEATRDAIKQARRIKSLNPLSTIVMTGCAAQVDGARLDALPGVDLVIANSHKGELESILDQHFRGTLKSKVFRSNIFRKDDLEAGGGSEAEHTRTFLKIQDGCNSFCSFCVIPYARGKSRSLSIPDLVERIGNLHASGINEAVLTGVHIGDYEDPGKPGSQLHDLVAAVLKYTRIPRLRLSSLEPIELTPQLMELFRDERLCSHFHMSIQSANTRVLHAMKRKYGSDEIGKALMDISERVPNAFVGMDVIAGFPGETREEFEDTYLRLSELPWTRLHVFPYSERPGTRAALIEEVVPLPERKLRAQRLRELSSMRFREVAIAQKGLHKKVLVLQKPARGAHGLSRDYWPVRLVDFQGQVLSEDSLLDEKWHGKEIDVEITGYDESHVSRMDGHLIAREMVVS
jgi:threonylcarbamoyladenosine tRNA methylthiotransferase MtaB